MPAVGTVLHPDAVRNAPRWPKRAPAELRNAPRRATRAREAANRPPQTSPTNPRMAPTSASKQPLTTREVHHMHKTAGSLEIPAQQTSTADHHKASIAYVLVCCATCLDCSDVLNHEFSDALLGQSDIADQFLFRSRHPAKNFPGGPRRGLRTSVVLEIAIWGPQDAL